MMNTTAESAYEYTYFSFDEVDITPTRPMIMVGFGQTEPSAGILDPLRAQISIWKQADFKCCLVTIDHIGYVRRANESLRRIHAGWGNAISTIGLNRRPSSEQCDGRIGILKVTDALTGKLALILLRLTAHNNVLKGDNEQISADYFGAVRKILTAKYDCPVMVTQGASGNIAPRWFSSKLNPPDACDGRFIRSDSALQDMAKEVYKSVDAVIDSIQTKEIHHLNMYSSSIILSSEVPSLSRAKEVALEAKREAYIDGEGWLKEVERLNSEKITIQTERVEIQYFWLQDGCFCGVPNEIMCEFALQTKESLNLPFFYFGGYTNGCTAYFPTEEEFDYGGFEVYWSLLIYYCYHNRVYPLKRESASELIHAVVNEARQYLKAKQ